MIKNLIYISIFLSLISANVLSIDLGFIQLSSFRLITLLLLISLFFRSLSNHFLIKLPTKKNNKYSIYMMATWFFYAILSLGWVKDYGSWFKAVYFIGIGLICILIYTSWLKTSEDILKSFQIMTLMIIVHNAIGWYEIITADYLFLSAERIIYQVGLNRPVSMFNNTNNYGTLMLMSIFIVYISFTNAQNKVWKLIYLVTIGSSVYLLIKTGSRANILGLILALVVFFNLSIKNRRGRKIIFTLLMAIFVMILIAPSILQNSIMMISNNLSFGFLSESGSDPIRINLIKNGLVFLLKTFGFGTGAGNIEYWMSNYSPFNTGGIVNIHNWWMEILTGYGLIIFALYLMFYINLLSSLYKMYKNSKNRLDQSISLGLICCMVGYVIGSVSSSSNMSSEWLWVFWSLAISYQGIANSFRNKVKIEANKSIVEG